MTQEDLNAIEAIVDKSVEKAVDRAVEKAVERAIRPVRDDLAVLKKDVASMKENVQLLAALNQLEAIRQDQRLMMKLRQAV